jgi:hypothetical protein
VASTRHGGSLSRCILGEPTSFCTSVKGILTLLVKSRQSISNAMGMRVTSGMYVILWAFKRSMQDRLSTRF